MSNQNNTFKKILILSPINQWGGVNIDVGFIAKIYREAGYKIHILSLGDYYQDCSIFEFVSQTDYNSVNRVLVKKNSLTRIFLKTLNFFKPLDIPIDHRVDNRFIKRFFNIDKVRLHIIKSFIIKHDTIILCHHFTGKYVKEIATIAHNHNKNILFRVTAKINRTFITPSFIKSLKKVDGFILHSQKNSKVLEPVFGLSKIKIIDQCVFNEDKYLQSKIDTQHISFYTLCRLDKIKNVAQIIKAFLACKTSNISLHIYGEGIEKETLKKLAANDKRIIFYPVVAIKDVYKIHNKHNCLLISSIIEGGPYTALEAMAAGNLIISTRVGAMEERLGVDYPLFYNGSTKDLVKKIKDVLGNDSASIHNLSNQLKAIYDKAYTYKKIKKQYLKLLNPEKASQPIST